ncbi:DUF4870 domain-containing protein [Paucilactobacillus nenjiangensis]|uniref:DUF4870 domain-containing protein n=1 Tax=Paucilactobacillus nenjiangensis TaxID=1296540 RepID=UPI0028D50889|nr:DUF4870 domain-containing protein [Paucilactobacillus nenjiangensis]
METNQSYKIVNGFSYLSILFLPIIFPLIVWLLAGDRAEMRYHAIRAFWLHLIPTLLTMISVILIGSVGLFTGNAAHVGWLSIILIGVLAIVSFVLFIYNIVKAVQIFIS